MLQSLFFVIVVLAGTALSSWPLGRYLRWAMDPPEPPDRPGRWTRLFEAVVGGRGRAGRGWKRYAAALLVFNAVSFTLTTTLLALQQHLPLNPDRMGPISSDLIFNTAASFVTNTNLQHYAGESTMSYLSQLAALMWQQFVSAATGIAALAALSRALAGREPGDFFIDLQRASFLVLLPLALILALILVAVGAPMTLDGAAVATTLEGAAQTIARGPVAAFVAIKQLGTNGGGFFGPNSTHPFENPGFWANLAETMAIILIPMACVWMFGRIVGRTRHAAIIFAVMAALMMTRLGLAMAFEAAPTRAFAELAVTQDAGNLEGKELRFGTAAGPTWAVLTTSTSNGSVNAMHDSLNPLTGLMPMIGMWLNEDFGGVGVGTINMFVFVILAVFIAGMMVGRTPEYLGRKVEGREIKLAMLTALSHAALILAGVAIFAVTSWGAATVNNAGPHGFSEILYEFSSSAANNGSGFEGLGDNTIPWNVATGVVMLLARFVPIILPLAIAGSLGGKRQAATTAGTLGVEDATFAAMLAATVLIFGALTFLPAAALGPVAEHLSFMR
jgi:K+-transporting ATPase ATPase A chain